MLCFPGSGGCLSEPQSLLCTGEVLPASPAFVPRGSSSSAHQSNPVRGSPAWFSLSGKRCRGLAASGQSGGNLRSSCMALCGPPLALVVHLCQSFCVCWGHHHHRHRHDLAFCLQNCLHHLYWGRHTTCSSHFTAATAGFLCGLPPPEPPAPPVVFFPTCVPSASSRPSLSEESLSP